jgi:hypothetical protein
VCNSWSRDHRTKGFIPGEVAIQFDPTEELIKTLVRERLWVEHPDGYCYRDWEEWNSDEVPKSTAAKLVHSVIPSEHPSGVRAKLTNEVGALFAEGIEYRVVEAALKLWLGKPNAAPSWLPMLVSDVTRKGGFAERDAALREAWKTGDTKPLQRFGLVFTPPDLPLDVKTPEAARFFMLAAKRVWIEQLRREQ